MSGSDRGSCFGGDPFEFGKFGGFWRVSEGFGGSWRVFGPSYCTLQPFLEGHAWLQGRDGRSGAQILTSASDGFWQLPGHDSIADSCIANYGSYGGMMQIVVPNFMLVTMRPPRDRRSRHAARGAMYGAGPQIGIGAASTPAPTPPHQTFLWS